MKATRRAARGNMLVVAVGLIAAIFLPIFVLCSNLAPFYLDADRGQAVVEASSKVAAMDLSRIVIDDPQFGLVSLSNHRAVGEGTIGSDGRPLPVIGINTLVALIRHCAVVGHVLANPTIEKLAESDAAYLDETIKDLDCTLNEAISGSPRGRGCRDIEGARVDPFLDTESFLKANLPGNLELVSLSLSLGWLDGGSETTIAIPQPLDLAELPKGLGTSLQYQSFTDYKVGSRHFTFAGLGQQAHLVALRNFKPADGKHICSIVRVECTLARRDKPGQQIECAAACQPYSLPDQSPAGALTVRFSNRPVAGMLSWSECLSDLSFRDRRLSAFLAINGDYPLDKHAHLQPLELPAADSTAREFARHLYCWMRSCHGRARLDAVVSMIGEPFCPEGHCVYSYAVEADGSISRTMTEGGKFARAVVADGQTSTLADTQPRAGRSAVIIFRNSVDLLSIESGRHAGNPLCGYPLGAVDGGLDYEALVGEFARRDAYNSGLAVDVEIGGTADSSAASDMSRMRARTANRRA